MNRYTFIIAILFALLLTGCGKTCKECYLIEEHSSSEASSKLSVGEHCEDDIDDLESKEIKCNDGDCYYSCE